MSTRVLHAVPSLVPQAGATSILLARLFAALRNRGVASSVITTHGRSFAADLAVDRCHEPRGLNDALRDADVVHLHGWDRGSATALIDAASAGHMPIIISPLGGLSPNPYEERGRLSRFMRDRRDRRMLDRAAKVTAMNESEAAGLRAMSPKVEVRVLPYGFGFVNAKASPDEIANSKASASDGDRILLFLGPIDPIEGLVPLLRAVAELGHDFRGWKLVLAGPEPGSWRKKLEAALYRKRTDDRVVFVTDPDLTAQRRLLAGASSLIAPALCDRPPVSVMQALSAGVPVVASPHGLPAEIASAVQVCEPTREALRDTLRPLMTADAEQLRRIGSEGREAASRLLDWTVLAPRIIELYEAARSC